jgi:hypothetical protein
MRPHRELSVIGGCQIRYQLTRHWAVTDGIKDPAPRPTRVGILELELQHMVSLFDLEQRHVTEQLT